MSTVTLTNDSLLADDADDSCRLQFIEIVPLTRDTDHSSTTECDSRDLFTEAKEETLPVVKHESDDVCYAVCFP